MKTFSILIKSTIITLLIFSAQGDAFAQSTGRFQLLKTNSCAGYYPRDWDHTGPTWGQLLTFSLIATSGVIVAQALPKTQPELYIKRANIINKDSSLTAGHEQIFSQLRGFTTPCMVKQKSPSRDTFGILRSIGDKGFVVETRLDSVQVLYYHLKEIMDLPCAAKRAKYGRIKLGIILTGFAGALFYDALITDDPQFSDDRAFYWAGSCIELCLAAYLFINKSKEEREYKIWQADYAPGH